MSQITNYNNGGGPTPPGSGIETITGNDGTPTYGDGGTPNNVNIIGAGTISVDQTAAHTLTITDTAAAATYYTSDGNYATPAAGRLNIYQGANIATTSAIMPANTVTVALTPNVTLAGFLHAGTEITSNTYVQANGNITSGAILQGANLTITSFAQGALVTDGTGVVSSTNSAAGTVLTANGVGAPTFQAIPFPAAPTVAGTANQIAVTAGPNYFVSLPAAIITPGSLQTTTTLRAGTDLTVANNVTFTAKTNGVLQTNGGGAVSATNGNPNGTNGQVIISGPVSPVWANLAAGAGITITNPAPNNITIAATPAAAHSSFFANLNPEANVSGDNTAYRVGAKTATTISYNINGDYYPGNGAGVPAFYTVPITGTYLFTFDLSASIQITTGGLGMVWYLTDGANYFGQVSLPTLNRTTNFYGESGWIEVPGSALMHLTAGTRIYMVFRSTGGAKVDSIAAGSFAGCFLF